MVSSIVVLSRVVLLCLVLFEYALLKFGVQVVLAFRCYCLFHMLVKSFVYLLSMCARLGERLVGWTGQVSSMVNHEVSWASTCMSFA